MSAPLPAPLPVPAPIAAPVPGPIAAPPSVAHAPVVIASSPSPMVVVIMRLLSIAILLPMRRTPPIHHSITHPPVARRSTFERRLSRRHPDRSAQIFAVFERRLSSAVENGLGSRFRAPALPARSWV